MLLRLSVFFVLHQVCETEYAISLEVALLRTNGSVDNVLPFELGGHFAMLGKYLKLSVDKRRSDYFEVELLRLEVLLDKMKNVILNKNKEVEGKLMELQLLENVERPLLKNWQQMLNFLKDPTIQEWKYFEHSCPRTDSNFLMKRLKVNVDRSNHIIVEQMRNGSIEKRLIHDLNMAIQKNMLLTILLFHICGGALHGRNFDEISDDSVLYMRALHHNILDNLDIDKLTLQAESITTTTTPGGLTKNGKVDKRQHLISEMEEFTRLSKMVGVTSILAALEAGECLPGKLGTMMELLGKVLSSFDSISELNYLDENREIMQQFRSVEEHLEHLSKHLTDIDKQITSGHRELILKINDATITQDVLAPLNVMREYFETFVRSPREYNRNRLYEQCKNDLPRQWMSKLKTHTLREKHDQKKLILMENFSETNKQEIEFRVQYRINMMYNITVLHSFCHGMLLGTEDAPEVDVEVEFVAEMFKATRNEMFAVLEWRSENYFTDPKGVEGVIRNAAKKVPTDQPHSALSNKTRDDLKEKFPSHGWVVLVYSGSSSIEKPALSSFPDLKCDESAFRLVTVNENRKVFVVRTKKQSRSTENGVSGELRKNMRYGQRTSCYMAYLLTNDCEMYLQPEVKPSPDYCGIVVGEKEPVGISATPFTYSTRTGGGISICHFGCGETFTLMVKDPQTENIG